MQRVASYLRWYVQYYMHLELGESIVASRMTSAQMSVKASSAFVANTLFVTYRRGYYDLRSLFQSWA